MSTATAITITAPTIEPIEGKRGEYILSCEMFVPLPRETIFGLFADAFELERITPEWLHFQVLTPRPIEMKPGALIDYKLKLHGIPITWRTEISEWDPPFKFVDQQLKGPYHIWHHSHTFEETDGGTLVKDRVHYCVPGGRLAHWLMVRKDLERIFSYRQTTLKRIFEDEYGA